MRSHEPSVPQSSPDAVSGVGATSRRGSISFSVLEVLDPKGLWDRYRCLRSADGTLNNRTGTSSNADT